MGRDSHKFFLARLLLSAVMLIATAYDPAAAQQSGRLDDTIEIAIRAGQFAQAARLLVREAETGSVEAQYRLASLYRSGRVHGADDAQAFRWMKSAALRGHAKAQHMAGVMLLSGRGTPIDKDAARVFLTKAADQGIVDARLLLAGGDKVRTTIEPPLQVRNDVATKGRPDLLRPASLKPSHLLDAASRGTLPILTAAITSGVSVETRDEDGNTGLLRASRAGRPHAVKILLEAGANPDALNNDGDTPMIIAAIHGHADVIAILLANHAKPDIRGKGNRTALAHAAHGCHSESVARLLRAGSEPRIEDTEGQTPAVISARKCSSDIVGHFVADATAANAKDNAGRSLLWHAADAGNASSLQFLLNRGADTSAVPTGGTTAFLRALEKRHDEVARHLIKGEQKIGLQTPTGNTAIILSAAMGSVDLVQACLWAGANANMKNAAGYTALMIAARDGHIAVVKALLDAGADRALRTSKRETAQELALVGGHRAIAELLR